MKQTRCESWECVCWRDLCEYSKRMLSLSPTSSQKIISILFSEGTWRLSAQATIFGENLTLPQWIPSRKVRNKHPPSLSPSTLRISLKYAFSINEIGFIIESILRTISLGNLSLTSPSLGCLERTNGQQQIYLPYTFSWQCSHIWKRQASLWGCIYQMLWML